MTPDVAAAKVFYAAVLGWTYAEHEVPGGVYTLALAPGTNKPVAGLFPWPADRPRSNDWFAYVAVDDMDEALRKAEAAGGRVLRAPWPVKNVGRLAIIADSVGAAIGYLESASVGN